MSLYGTTEHFGRRPCKLWPVSRRSGKTRSFVFTPVLHSLIPPRSKRERVHYKRRMAGKRARELAADKKLVETHGHLLPKMRGSERRRLLEQGVAPEEIDQMEETLPTEKAKVMGKEKLRQKLRVDGGVEFEGVSDDDNGMEVDSD
jgi:large subunit ribosomal protein L24e